MSDIVSCEHCGEIKGFRVTPGKFPNLLICCKACGQLHQQSMTVRQITIQNGYPVQRRADQMRPNAPE